MVIEVETLEENALQELKRADHLIYVTLKYTRTADVIKNIIKRLINAYDFSVLSALECIGAKPDIIRRSRINQLGKYLKDVKSDAEFYLFLCKVDQAAFERKEEYRKNVALITRFGEINIAILQKYFNRTKEFVVLIEDFISKCRVRKERALKRKHSKTKAFGASKSKKILRKALKKKKSVKKKDKFIN